MKNLSILILFLLVSNYGWAQTQILKSPIYYKNEKVGIGTNNPSEKLHINGKLFMNAGEGFRLYGNSNYFGEHLDGIVFQMEDINGKNGTTDGGFVFRGYTSTDKIAQDWMVIKTGGKVGIGTKSPSESLHLNGKLFMNAGEGFRLYGNSNYFGEHLDGIVFQMEDINGKNGTTDGGFVFRGYTSTDKIAQDWMVIKTGGKVGIGTKSPSESLHLNGKFFMNAGEGFRLYGDTHFFGDHLDGIVFQMEDTNSSNGNTDGGFVFRGYTPTDKIAQDWMVIKSGGKVGIGTTTPDAKLTVAGKVHAQEIVVSVEAGADFVFAEDYELPDLSELESFITEKKHLPEIPSEKDMQQNGLELGEMNIRLLQKVEELTLYMIKQNKTLKKQEEQLHNQEQQLAIQNKRLQEQQIEIESLKSALRK